MNTTNLILLLQEQLVYALHSPRFLQWLEELTGAEKLCLDPPSQQVQDI